GVGSSLLSVDEGQQVDEHGDTLTRARRAYAAQDWRSAAARFDAAPPERLTADDLAAYADAVWWLGRIEDHLRVRGVRAAGCGLVGPCRTSGRGDPGVPGAWVRAQLHRCGGESHGRPTGGS